MTYDLGYDGEIDLIEFLKIIDAPSSPITRKAFRLMDTQQTGALNFVEFVSHVTGYATMSLEQIARFAFEVYTESTRMQQKGSCRQLSIRHIIRLISDTHDDSCTIESLSEKNIIDACRQCKFPHLIIEEYCTSYYTNHICVNLIVVHGNAAKQFVTADEFVSIARSNEGIIEPLLAFRRKIIENVVGILFWEKIADRIRIRNDDAKDRAVSSLNDAKVELPLTKIIIAIGSNDLV